MPTHPNWLVPTVLYIALSGNQISEVVATVRGQPINQPKVVVEEKTPPPRPLPCRRQPELYTAKPLNLFRPAPTFLETNYSETVWDFFAGAKVKHRSY